MGVGWRVAGGEGRGLPVAATPPERVARRPWPPVCWPDSGTARPPGSLLRCRPPGPLSRCPVRCVSLAALAALTCLPPTTVMSAGRAPRAHSLSGLRHVLAREEVWEPSVLDVRSLHPLWPGVGGARHWLGVGGARHVPGPSDPVALTATGRAMTDDPVVQEGGEAQGLTFKFSESSALMAARWQALLPSVAPPPVVKSHLGPVLAGKCL